MSRPGRVRRTQELLGEPRPNASVLDRAIKEYGLTDWWPDAGFILSDGSMLDLSGGGAMGRAIDHRNVGQFYSGKRSLSGWESMVWFVRLTGAIRFMPESMGFDLFVEPTRKQIATMLEIVEESGRPPILDMQGPRGKKHYREYEEWELGEFRRDLVRFW